MRHSCLRLCARGCEYAMTRSLIGVYYLIMLSWLSAYKFYAWDRPEVTMRLLALIPGGALHTHALKAAFVVGCAIFAACGYFCGRPDRAAALAEAAKARVPNGGGGRARTGVSSSTSPSTSLAANDSCTPYVMPSVPGVN